MLRSTDDTGQATGWTIAECRVTGGRIMVTGRRSLAAALREDLTKTRTAANLSSGVLPLKRHLVFIGPPQQGGKRRLVVIHDSALRDLMGGM